MSDSTQINDTIKKFGYPATLVKEYEQWVVLARPQQVTLGALILACKGEAQAFSRIGGEAFAELPAVIADIEFCLGGLWSYDRINYLMLMMVDKEVHYHVLPRYAEAREFAGVSFSDAGWPALPDLGAVNEIGEDAASELLDCLRREWPAR